MRQRAQFATKMGAIAATVGSAVGLGNIWRFPYEAGQHGGSAFLILYLACVMVIGVPAIVAEFVIGRGTHKNVSGAVRALAPGKRMHWATWPGIVASLLILSFYSVVCGWIVEYLFQAVAGTLRAGTLSDYHRNFSAFVANPWRCSLWTVLFLLLNMVVVRRGVKRGIERVARVMMPLLFLLLLVFCVNSLLMPGAREGLRFLFHPDFSQLTPRVAIGAMGQAFFSLSLGLSCLLTYSSYFKDDTPLVKNACVIALLDSLVAMMAGVMIFPAVYSFGMEPQAGPTLVFEVLPAIFYQLPGGYVWAVLFFALLFFASLTSTISMSEISITYFQEEYAMSRARATWLNTGIALVLGVLCALSFGVLNRWTVCGLTLFELFDYVSSNIILPLGGMFYVLFVGWWVNRTFVDNQLTNGGTLKMAAKGPLMLCMRWVAPAAILLVFLYGLGLLG